MYQLVSSLEDVVELRRQTSSPGQAPLRNRIVHITEAAAKNCCEVLDDLARKCFDLGAKDDLTWAVRLRGRVAFTLSAKNIHILEQNMLSAIISVQTALELLNGLDGAYTIQILRRIEGMMKRMIMGLEQPTSLKQQDSLDIFLPSGGVRDDKDSGVELKDDEDLSEIGICRAVQPDRVPIPSTSDDILSFEEELDLIFSNIHRSISEKKLSAPRLPGGMKHGNDDVTPALVERNKASTLDRPELPSQDNHKLIANKDDKNKNDRATDKKHFQEDAILAAIKRNDLEASREIIRQGVSGTALSLETPLAFAVKHNDAAFVDLLISAGANPNIIDDDRWSLVHYAVDRNCENALSALLKCVQLKKVGLEVDSRCSMNWTPLMHLAQRSCRPENTKLANRLLDHGANIHAVDDDGYSALWYAIQESASDPARVKFVKGLIMRGADVDSVHKQAPQKMARYLSALKRAERLGSRMKLSS